MNWAIFFGLLSLVELIFFLWFTWVTVQEVIIFACMVYAIHNELSNSGYEDISFTAINNVFDEGMRYFTRNKNNINKFLKDSCEWEIK